MRLNTLLATSCAALVALPAGAQTPPQFDTKAAAAAFGVRERILDVSLSPDGSKIAMVAPGPEQSAILQVFDTASGTSKPIYIADGKPLTLRDCGWASNARLLCRLYGISDRDGPLRDFIRTISMNADGTGAISLTAKERAQDYAQSSDGYVVDWRDGTTDKVLFARNYVRARANDNIGGGMAEGLGVDLLDTRTGKADHVESPDRVALAFLGDGQGTIRIKGTDEAFRSAGGYESRGETTFVYRTVGSRDWKPFSVYSIVTEKGMYPVAVDGKANVAYVLQKKDGRDALYRVSLDGSMKQELAYADNQVDVDGVVRVGRQGRIVGASFSHELPEIAYFDPAYEALLQRLHKALPQLPLLRIVDSSTDETKHIIHGSSDTNPGRYYLFDTVAKRLTPIGQDRPDLTGIAIGAVKPITYKAADGTSIPAYLTLPPGGAGKNIPAIVMPHGGPASRDEWGFDWLVQFFVNRGYAVLQPNYRGSSGYGQGWFQENGFRSWKSAIGDVNDAGRWLVAQGIADPAKLAIVGWSYGGYAALQAQVLDSKLFKAAVAIAPVTDLGELRGERYGKIARDYIGTGPQLEEGSPARHAAVFNVPVIMFHGTTDVNVPINQSKLMDRNLKKAGKSSELVVYPNIDHQLRDSVVRADMLSRADAFLTKSLGR